MFAENKEKQSIRSAYGKTLVELGAVNKDIVVLDADLSCSTQTKLFAKEYPERFFNLGIAEQNLMATAAGLAAEGKIPCAQSSACWLCCFYFCNVCNRKSLGANKKFHCLFKT